MSYGYEVKQTDPSSNKLITVIGIIFWIIIIGFVFSNCSTKSQDTSNGNLPIKYYNFGKCNDLTGAERNNCEDYYLEQEKQRSQDAYDRQYPF